jgi:hypothetical protein
MGQKKTWREKLTDSKDLPRVEAITDRMSKRWGTGTVVISAPIEIDEIMKKVAREEADAGQKRTTPFFGAH